MYFHDFCKAGNNTEIIGSMDSKQRWKEHDSAPTLYLDDQVEVPSHCDTSSMNSMSSSFHTCVVAIDVNVMFVSYDNRM